MNTINLITFASVFVPKTESAIRESHSELFGALDSRYNVNIVFEDQPLPTDGLSVIFIASGGTEGMVVRRYSELQHPLVLLTDGKSNSLAASLELSCWVRQHGDKCTILHGPTEVILERLAKIDGKMSVADNSMPNAQEPVAYQALYSKVCGARIGVIGQPSDWLVSSHVDYAKVFTRWGIEIIDLTLDTVNQYYNEAVVDGALLSKVDSFINNSIGCKEPNRDEIIKAMRLYVALRRMVDENHLDAITLQCFSLIPTTGTTGCLALALLNDEGFIAGCEGDIPSAFTMLLAKRITGEDAFMANPSHIDVTTDEVLFAHCTIGLKRCNDYIIRSHFESQSGVAIQGILPVGDVTVLKVGGSSLENLFACDGEILENQDDPHKCRTQIRVKLGQTGAAEDYFLRRSISNHHIIIPGHHADVFK